MTAESDAGLDGLVERLDSAGRAYDKVLVRWLMDAGLPLFSACVLLVLDPQDGPMRLGEVAEAMGISTDDAARALHELRSLGYAREEKRLYEATAGGMQLHASLESARREALAASLSSLGEDERRELAEALSKLPGATRA
jgi:DNA-binding MarR family transcriptional regulator